MEITLHPQFATESVRLSELSEAGGTAACAAGPPPAAGAAWRQGRRAATAAERARGRARTLGRQCAR